MPHVCLRGTKTQVGELENHGCRVDESSGHADESRGQAKASTVLNTGETVTMGNGGGTSAKPGTEDAGRDGAEPDNLANWSDTLSGHRDVPDTRDGIVQRRTEVVRLNSPLHIDTTADTTEYISTCQYTATQLNLPGKPEKQPTNDQAESRSHVGTPNMWVDMCGVAKRANTAGNTQQRVSTCTEDPEPPDLPDRSTRACIDEADGLESCPGMLSIRIHVQGDAGNWKRPEKMSETLDLLAEGQNHAGVSQRGSKANRTCRTRAQARRGHGFTRRALRTTREYL